MQPWNSRSVFLTNLEMHVKVVLGFSRIVEVFPTCITKTRMMQAFQELTNQDISNQAV